MKLQAAARPPRRDLIALIDCMFLILVSFVYAFLGMTQNQGLAVNLPGAAVHVLPPAEDSYTVTIGADGMVALNAQAMQPADVALRVASRYRPGETQVLLQGDEGARHGRVVQVLDLLRRAGVEKVSVQTQGDLQ